MKQLSIFSMSKEASSLMISEQNQKQNQSNLSAHITASKLFEDDINIFRFNNDEDSENWGDIYDDYEDFDVTSRTWH